MNFGHLNATVTVTDDGAERGPGVYWASPQATETHARLGTSASGGSEGLPFCLPVSTLWLWLKRGLIPSASFPRAAPLGRVLDCSLQIVSSFRCVFVTAVCYCPAKKFGILDPQIRHTEIVSPAALAD